MLLLLDSRKLTSWRETGNQKRAETFWSQCDARIRIPHLKQVSATSERFTAVTTPFMGLNSPKTPVLRTWIGVFQSFMPNIETSISLTLLYRLLPNLHSDRDHKVYTLRGWSKLAPIKSSWQTAAIWKNRNILITSQPVDRFWRTLNCWCTVTTPFMGLNSPKVDTLDWTRRLIKFHDFKTPRWRWRPA